MSKGRKIALEWSEVLKIDNDSKCKCKHCNELISAKIERIRGHLNKCLKYPQNQIRSMYLLPVLTYLIYCYFLKLVSIYNFFFFFNF